MADRFEDKHNVLIDAVHRLRAAILLLDEADAPAHIAAHVDLAATEIDEVIARGRRIGGVTRRDGPDPFLSAASLKAPDDRVEDKPD